jgi:excinuclease ABC subunit C
MATGQNQSVTDALANAKRALPRAPGVYRFRDGGGRVLYIGRAADLRSRVRSYWGDLRDRKHLSAMVPRIAEIEAVACDSEHEAAWLERSLIAERKPPWNRAIGGAEVEVYIRLTARGLSVVHDWSEGDGIRCFGPYLGGLQARTAVSGLHRIFPLRYVGGQSGSERMMSDALGITAGDGDAMRAEVAAVLDRQPRAMAEFWTAIHAYRDKLVAELRFESAAKIQKEIESLDWVLAEQKVALMSPTDVDICAWADGRLLRFEMRGGRVRSWAWASCAEDVARPLVAATPTGWSAFAQRNVSLAAALAAET